MSISGSLSKTSDYTIFTICPCPYCDLAKVLLRENDCSIYEVAVDIKPSLAMDIVNFTGRRTWPQIFKGEEFIGGYTELKLSFQE